MQSVTYTASVHGGDDGGYWAEVPALVGCYSQGDSIAGALRGLSEAIQCHLQGLAIRGEEPPVENDVRDEILVPVTVFAHVQA